MSSKARNILFVLAGLWALALTVVWPAFAGLPLPLAVLGVVVSAVAIFFVRRELDADEQRKRDAERDTRPGPS